jgi:DMSO reductase anchor subunit
MLVLTQMGAGIHWISALHLLGAKSAPQRAFSIAAALSLAAGLMISVFHLGRPLKAWRAFLGWRRSWMSREILAFGAYALLAAVLVASPGAPHLRLATATLGAIAVFSSAMIYVDTPRQGWSAKVVFPSFFGTAALLGCNASAALCAWVAPDAAAWPAAGAALIPAPLFVWRMSGLVRLKSPVFRLARGTRTAALALFSSGTLFSLLAIYDSTHIAWWASAACCVSIAGQILDRWIFFAGTPSPRMPGAFTP